MTKETIVELISQQEGYNLEFKQSPNKDIAKEICAFANSAGSRTEQLEVPLVALREGLLNSLAHRDYYEKGAVIMVEVYDNRVVISNPGPLSSAIPVEQFGKKVFPGTRFYLAYLPDWVW